MGQKIHPLGLRIGITQKHRSTWFAKSNIYPRLVFEDKLLRRYILAKYPTANIVDINIQRHRTTQDLETKTPFDLVELSIRAAVPGKIIDWKNKKKSITHLKKTLENFCQKSRLKSNQPQIRISLNILKVSNAYSEAPILADYLIQQLEERTPFRVALKKSLKRMSRSKLKGIKIQISGRLNGAEIARTEWVRKGRVPLQTLRANIDYSYKTAKTIYGILGIKVWTFKGEN